MKLTKKQKDQIYNKSMAVDDWEWVPCINHVLKILNYEDLLEHDENYEWVKWTGTEPLIKDEEIREYVKKWIKSHKEECVRIEIENNFVALFCDREDYSQSAELDLPYDYFNSFVRGEYYNIEEL